MYKTHDYFYYYCLFLCSKSFECCQSWLKIVQGVFAGHTYIISKLLLASCSFVVLCAIIFRNRKCWSTWEVCIGVSILVVHVWVQNWHWRWRQTGLWVHSMIIGLRRVVSGYLSDTRGWDILGRGLLHVAVSTGASRSTCRGLILVVTSRGWHVEWRRVWGR